MTYPIKKYSLKELLELIRELKQPAFRAKQLYQWLYVHQAKSYDEMSNLPLAFRQQLSNKHPLYTPTVINIQISQDGTRKYLLRYHDDIVVESVAIPSRDGSRLTVCFSTQAGCAMSCAFCATGKEGFSRNLLAGEIVDQVLLVQQDFGTRVTNIVGMGQGEPFLNYSNTLEALRILNDPQGVAIGARHISISTCGILSGIDKLSLEPEQFTLAVSLHSANQATRDYLMPKVSHFTLSELKKSLQNYVSLTNRRVTLEYIMIDGVNDSNDDLKKLAAYTKDLLCHINLIPINSIPGSIFQPSSPAILKRWIPYLEERGISTTLRDSRGSDIDGACGQLKNTYKK